MENEGITELGMVAVIVGGGNLGSDEKSSFIYLFLHLCFRH